MGSRKRRQQRTRRRIDPPPRAAPSPSPVPTVAHDRASSAGFEFVALGPLARFRVEEPGERTTVPVYIPSLPPTGRRAAVVRAASTHASTAENAPPPYDADEAYTPEGDRPTRPVAIRPPLLARREPLTRRESHAPQAVDTRALRAALAAALAVAFASLALAAWVATHPPRGQVPVTSSATTPLG